MTKKMLIELEWKDPVTDPPEPFVSVLVYLPGDAPLPTVHEGYMADTGVWWAGHTFRLPQEIAEWADMPTRDQAVMM